MNTGGGDLWCVRPDSRADDAELQRCRSLLTPEEQQAVDRFSFPELRRDRLISKALVRTALSAYTDVPPAAWRFRSGHYGKPEVAAPVLDQNLHFSISHTDGLITCLVGVDHEVGVDVECLDRVGDAVSMAVRYFSAEETSALCELSESEQSRRFLELWTLKEAYGKARGLGLRVPLDAAAFELEAEGCGVPRARFGPALSDDPSRWRFTVNWVDETHVMATCRHLGASVGMTSRIQSSC